MLNESNNNWAVFAWINAWIKLITIKFQRFSFTQWNFNSKYRWKLCQSFQKMVVYLNECQPRPAPQFVFISRVLLFCIIFLLFSPIDDNTQQPRGRKEAESYIRVGFGHVARHADVTLQPPAFALLEATWPQSPYLKTCGLDYYFYSSSSHSLSRGHPHGPQVWLDMLHYMFCTIFQI
jgi:hypothetical protein